MVATVLGVTAVSPGRASAQNPGTVTWTATYPKKQDTTPPPPMLVPGWIEALGDYTTNAGWTPTVGQFYWMPQAGGVPLAQDLKIMNGKIGVQDPTNANNIIAYRQNFNAGNWSVWLAVIYTRPKAGGGTEAVPVLSSFQNVTIK